PAPKPAAAASEARAEAPAAPAARETETTEDDGAGTKPALRDAPRAGGADDLKQIKGVGPKLEQLLNRMGIYHFDQIAGWSADEVAWVDANLEGFKGRVTRDDWVAQARALASGERG
ncbi:MAG: NADH-quinone oxidoreductase subunit E, partial [Rhodosalinus sp.]